MDGIKELLILIIITQMAMLAMIAFIFWANLPAELKKSIKFWYLRNTKTTYRIDLRPYTFEVGDKFYVSPSQGAMYVGKGKYILID
jgi:hypothetical protein